MTTDQQKLWAGVFGDYYQDRNKLTDEEVEKREPFLLNILQWSYSVTGHLTKSVLEIGAGQGPNILALERISIKSAMPMMLYATELNQKARLHLSENCKTVQILDSIPNEPIADMVFTYGVLIHTHPAHVKNLMDQIFKASKRFIVCCEYFAPETRPMMYRGEKDALWLDDYGSKWLVNHSLRLVGYGFAWKKVTGLDNVTYWIFEKSEKMH